MKWCCHMIFESNKINWISKKFRFFNEKEILSNHIKIDSGQWPMNQTCARTYDAVITNLHICFRITAKLPLTMRTNRCELGKGRPFLQPVQHVDHRRTATTSCFSDILRLNSIVATTNNRSVCWRCTQNEIKFITWSIVGRNMKTPVIFFSSHKLLAARQKNVWSPMGEDRIAQKTEDEEKEKQHQLTNTIAARFGVSPLQAPTFTLATSIDDLRAWYVFQSRRNKLVTNSLVWVLSYRCVLMVFVLHLSLYADRA